MWYWTCTFQAEPGFRERKIGHNDPLGMAGITPMFQRLKPRGRNSALATPRLTFAAFGKHPGWDDHMPDIGVVTEALATLKQNLYVGGIGSQIDSGAWERLEPEKRIEGFE